MRPNSALPIVAAAAALLASGCGGSTSAGSDTMGATGAAEGTVSTSSTGTTVAAGATFDVEWRRVNDQLNNALKDVEDGTAADRVLAAGTILDNCTDAVTNGLDSRADSSDQKQAVQKLRNACGDASQAASALNEGHVDTAKELAKTALADLQEANDLAK
jgi:hypothetical protein